MDDLAGFLQRHGWPGWIVAIVIGIAWLIDKLKLWPIRTKSDREILSMDEQSYRVALSKELESLREEIRKLYGELAECMRRHRECEEKIALQSEHFQETLKKAKSSFLEFLVKSAEPIPPVPGQEQRKP